MNEQDLENEDDSEAAADEAENAAGAYGHETTEDDANSTMSELDTKYEQEFRDTVSSWRLKHFSSREFLFLGGSHHSPGSPCRGLNAFPDKELWNNLKETAKVLDELRGTLQAPIRLNSVYRNEAYNRCLSGAAAESQHKKMRAVDFTAEDGRGPAHWRSVLLEMRNGGFFRGGIGIYNTFVHVDTRGSNRDWDQRT